MKEVLDSLTTTLRERLVSPLAGAFIVSWLIINYKVVVVLTSGMKPHVKFPYIEDVIWRDSYGLWMNSLVYPAIAALLYILIYPWPARWLLKYSLHQQNITKLMKIKVEGNHPVTREELEEAKQKWAEKITKQGEAIQRLEAQVEHEQKRAEIIAQSEQGMATRANQMAEELEEIKSSRDVALSEVEDLKSRLAELANLVKERNSTIQRLEGLVGADTPPGVGEPYSPPHQIKFARPKRSGVNFSGAARAEYKEDESPAGSLVSASVAWRFVLALLKHFGIRANVDGALIDKALMTSNSFGQADKDEFWKQVHSETPDFQKFSSAALSSWKEALLI